MHTPKHLAINDPAPMVLGERTTRLPPEPVNPRAAFEAFERGAHEGPTFTVGIKACLIGFDTPVQVKMNFDQRPQPYEKLARGYEAVQYRSALKSHDPEPDDGEGDTPDLGALRQDFMGRFGQQNYLTLMKALFPNSVPQRDLTARVLTFALAREDVGANAFGHRLLDATMRQREAAASFGPLVTPDLRVLAYTAAVFAQ